MPESTTMTPSQLHAEIRSRVALHIQNPSAVIRRKVMRALEYLESSDKETEDLTAMLLAP